MNDTHALKQRAIRLLARREHSRAELEAKLAALASRDEVDRVIAELEAAGLQSDARFAAGYVGSHAARLGAARLRQTLRQKGIASELIESELNQPELPDESERALELWRRKFGAAPADAREWARQARFLQSRGFGAETIRRLLKNLPEDES